MIILLSGILGVLFLLWIGLWQIGRRAVNFATYRCSERTTWPKVSLIVPIHNGGSALTDALSSMCELDYPNLEVIAINDRSTDHTENVLNAFAQRYPFLKVATLKACPQDWLGKVHALQKGIEQASGEYYVLTDADVMFGSALLSRVIDYVLTHDIQQFSVLPQLILRGFWFKVVMLSQALLLNIGLILNRGVIGIGAFNLISQQAYKKIGGMAALALAPVDDVQLSRVVQAKQCGKQGFGYAKQLLQVEWYAAIHEMKVGLEKNTFAFFRFSLLRVLVSVFVLLLLFLFPVFALFLGSGITACLAGVVCLITVMIYRRVAKSIPIASWYSLCYPAGILMALWIQIRAVLLCIKRGGISWGGRFYALAVLKKFLQL